MNGLRIPRQLIGIPYESHGRSLEAADCWGLVMLFYRLVLKINLPDYNTYSSAEDKESVSQVIEESAQSWREVQPEDLQPGDVLVFRLRGVPFHTGVYLGNGDFMHCHRNTRSCVERLWSICWRQRLEASYRWISP